MSNILNIKNLHAGTDNKEIIKGLELTVNKGEIHVIMGPNGAGKSTLANIIMGHPSFEVTQGELLFEGQNIADDDVSARARKGIFLSFQTPEEVDGITVENFLRTAKAAVTGESVKPLGFRKELFSTMEKLNFKEDYAARYLNVGFSGGEKKKNEILQMLMLNPKLAILDETDSGLDIDAVKTVSEGIKWYKNDDNAVIIITHNARLLESLNADYVHVLVDGKIVQTGDKNLMDEIIKTGFAHLKSSIGE